MTSAMSGGGNTTKLLCNELPSNLPHCVITLPFLSQLLRGAIQYKDATMCMMCFYPHILT